MPTLFGSLAYGKSCTAAGRNNYRWPPKPHRQLLTGLDRTHVCLAQQLAYPAVLFAKGGRHQVCSGSKCRIRYCPTLQCRSLQERLGQVDSAERARLHRHDGTIAGQPLQLRVAHRVTHRRPLTLRLESSTPSLLALARQIRCPRHREGRSAQTSLLPAPREPTDTISTRTVPGTGTAARLIQFNQLELQTAVLNYPVIDLLLYYM